MATWPASLPQLPNRESFSDVPQDTTIRSEMAGATKQRPRFTAAVNDVSEQYTMTRAQLDTFIAFYDFDLSNGALQFDKPDFIRGGVSQYIMTGPYDITVEGLDLFRVRLTMKKLP